MIQIATHSFATPMSHPEMAKEINLIRSTEMKFGSQFVKAASGVVYVDDSLYVVQDSSRYLAKFSPALDQDIEFIRLAPIERINQLEDPTKPYEEFRKDRKADFEAIAALPDGRLLILGSGYDSRHIGTTKAHYRNVGVLVDPKTKQYTELNLDHFYQHLTSRTDFIGPERDSIKPRLNIEGVSIFDRKIAFFHRSNFAKNNHDAMIAFELAPWLEEAAQHKTWQLKETALVRFDFGSIELNGTRFPITLNDAAYVDGHFILPVACETDTIVNGKDVDGEVIWTGIARVTATDNSYTMFKFSDKQMPKIEGITPDPKHPGQFYVVHDVDSEVTPSLLSKVALP